MNSASKSPMGSNREAGFTLLETLMAAAFVAVGLLALSAMQGISLARNVDASELTRVTNLASDIIERMQFNRQNVDQYNGVNTKASTPCPATMGIMARGDCLQWEAMLEAPAAKLSGVQGTVTVTAEGPTSPALNQRRVTVRVSWTGSMKSGATLLRSRSVTLETVIAPE
jgi:type IV pilus assembly protein PilV